MKYAITDPTTKYVWYNTHNNAILQIEEGNYSGVTCTEDEAEEFLRTYLNGAGIDETTRDHFLLMEMQSYDCPKCRSGGELSAAPNDDMPNAGEYDFLCTCGRLYNLTDVQ